MQMTQEVMDKSSDKAYEYQSYEDESDHEEQQLEDMDTEQDISDAVQIRNWFFNKERERERCKFNTTEII